MLALFPDRVTLNALTLLIRYLIRHFAYKGDRAMPRLKQIGIDIDINGVIERHRRTFSETENDILRRLLLLDSPKQAPRSPMKDPQVAQAPVRQRGLWSVELHGERCPALNLKGAYRSLLLKLQNLDSAFLQRFSLEQSRSRRFVSRRPKELYLASPNLAEDHAELLIDGWYFDTNLSTEQVAKRIRVAARLCNLKYGRDVRILNNFQEI